MPDFLDLDMVAAERLRFILSEAARRKAARQAGFLQGEGAVGKAAPDADAPLAGFVLALLFQRPSTRTRASFDIAMRQLGGTNLDLGGKQLQLQRGESMSDTGRVLERYVDIIVLRGDDHAQLQALADATAIPVINGLTGRSHPCQVMADILTFEEHKGAVRGRTLSWIGDGGNNMATSWIHAAAAFGFRLRFGCPERFAPDAALLTEACRQGAEIEIFASAQEAARGSDCIMTDTWISMSDSPESADARRHLLAPYQINESLMAIAPEAIFMHCLPAHRGEEATDGVLDGRFSRVFEEAENRLHVQKAILLHCLDKLAERETKRV